MQPKVAPLLLLLLSAVFVWLFVFYSIVDQPYKEEESRSFAKELSSIEERVQRLDNLVLEEQKQLKVIRNELSQALARDSALISKRAVAITGSPLRGPWPHPIPILVFVCNRATAARNHLAKLLKYRPSAELFPIIVTQDCDSEGVAETVREFGSQVFYIKHLSGARANISVPIYHRQWTTYYRIARHYKLALQHVFQELRHTSVVITEDDLDVAPDFFDYFSATRKLLKEDAASLWCVSAWNDNGKPELVDKTDGGLLYRGDFFSGLGWMMTSDLWAELGPIWPDGFWDDWMRDPMRRKNRTCIRPEISRTSMTTEGKSGASKGQFFNKHLIKVMLATEPVNFSSLDLAYLKKEVYDAEFVRVVYEESMLMSLSDAQKELLVTKEEGHRERPIRIEYMGNLDYIRKADGLHIMHDFKAGIPRTAYLGVVSCFINKRRIYLAPDRGFIHGYDPSWHVPDGTPE